MPLSRPVVIYNIVSQFIGFSTNTVWQIITLSSDTRQTVLVNLYFFVMQSYFGAGNGMGRKLAAGSMLLVPPLVVYFIFAKYITSLSLAYRMEDK
ncbi:MAG: hypothetical protein FJ088_16795 [Deltaproteobacteria bacterium]|nr:hypothetical protein [Deltaproteobacteria bacterium]